jgi:hypothetical protein
MHKNIDAFRCLLPCAFMDAVSVCIVASGQASSLVDIKTLSYWHSQRWSSTVCPSIQPMQWQRYQERVVGR